MSDLYSRIFHSPTINRIFSAENQVKHFLNFEKELLATLAEHQYLNPKEADQIINGFDKIDFDLDEIRESILKNGNPVISFLSVLKHQLQEKDIRTNYLHFGATSQDVIDSALMLQCKEAIDTTTEQVAKVIETLKKLVIKFRDLPIIGRTLMQQARPTSLGYKLALWMDAFCDTKKRLEQTSKESCIVQLGGSVGGANVYGTRAADIRKSLAAKLHLSYNEVPWHTNRDRIILIVMEVALLAQHVGKVSRNLILLTQNEIGEVTIGGGSSSTMPNKQNPVDPINAVAAINQVPGLVSNLLFATQHEHERAAGGWQSEWNLIPSIFDHTCTGLEHLANCLTHLSPNEARIKINLENSMGLIYSENIYLALRREMDDQKASELVTKACEEATNAQIHLMDYLLKPEILKGFPEGWGEEQVAALFDPQQFMEATQQFIDHILMKSEKI